MKGWAKVYQSANPIEAEIIRAMLEEQSVDAVLINHKDSSLLFGEAEVWCKTADESLAKRIISDPNYETPE